MKLPGILDAFLAARRLSGPEAAALFAVTHGCFYGWLSGKHVPQRKQAHRIAEVLARREIVKIIDSDRQVHERMRAAQAKRRGRAGVA